MRLPLPNVKSRKLKPISRWGFALTFVGMLLLADSASAQVASALLREGDPLPGGSGVQITGINNTAVNGVGGYAFTVTEDGSISYVWGDATGGTGTVMRVESTIGSLSQTSFESFFGMSDAGQISYSASSDHVSGTPTGLDGVWVDDLVVANEEDPISKLLGDFYSFNSRPGMMRDGEPYWIGGITDTQGGSTQNRALFANVGGQILFKGGDFIAGIPENAIVGSALSFDARVSGDGTNWVVEATVDASTTIDNVMVMNGSAMTTDGAVIREGTAISAYIGGLSGESWDNFDFVGITESGDYLLTGDSDASTSEDEFVVVNGMIVLREGGTIGAGTLTGSIDGGYMNEDGDWAVTWEVTTVSGPRKALIVNGEAVLLENDLVDWNGDGAIDGSDQGAFLTDFTGITSLTLSDRDADGKVDLVFTADTDVNGTELEGGYRLTIDLDGGEPVEVPPSSVVVTRGTYVSGGIAELATSDNSDFSARRNTADIQSRVFVEVKSVSPTASPVSFDFTFEGSVFARSNVAQSIDLFDYVANDWEEVDTRNASRFNDLSVSVSGTGDLSRFVEPGTNCIQARVRFQSAEARQNFSANIDQMVWTIE